MLPRDTADSLERALVPKYRNWLMTRKNNKWLFIPLLLAFVASIADANRILFEQTWDPAPFPVLSWLDGQELADNFSLASSAHINRIEWYGSFSDNQFNSSGSHEFVIRIMETTNEACGEGSPETCSMNILSEVLVAAQATDTGVVDSYQANNIFHFTATISGFDALANKTYWLSILGSGSDDGRFLWQVSDEGLGAARFVYLGQQDWGIRPDDRGNLAFSLQVEALTRTTNLDPANSAMGKTAHACLQLLTTAVSEGENCMYDGGASEYEDSPGSFPANPFGEAVGPLSQVGYYDSVASPFAFSPQYIKSPGDGKIRPEISGSITVDDAGNGFGADDLLSFTLTITSPDGGSIIRHASDGDDFVDVFESMTQVLAPTAVDSATPNASGGFDYVIGSEGFPVLLTFTDASANESTPGAGDGPCVGQTFGDMECEASFMPNALSDPLRWTPWMPTDDSMFAGQFPLPHAGPPQSAGLGTLEGNIGARTTGTLVNPLCVDLAGQMINNDCEESKVSFGPSTIGPNMAPGGGVTAENPGWDHVYLKVSTDAGGNVLTAEGFDLQEGQMFGPNSACGSDPDATINCNSWYAGHFMLTGIPTEVALPDSASTIQDAPVNIDVLANDIGFVDPVTVSIAAIPANGNAEPNTPTGNQADIEITYTPGPDFSGTDMFDYTVDDGVNSGTATVTVTVFAVSANDDIYLLDGMASQYILDIATNDEFFQDPVNVSIIDGPSAGSAFVNGSPGLLESIDITYMLPNGFIGSTSLTYRVVDINSNIDTALVTITVVDNDRDGVDNAFDNCLNTPNGPALLDPMDDGISQRNTDGDSQGDACDADDDNDGLSDNEELSIGTNRLIADTDEDGFIDSVDALPLDPNEWFDTDGDGVGENSDNCLNAPNGLSDTASAGPSQNDTNGDGYGNICDPDLNNDNVIDFGDLPLLQQSFFSQNGDPNWNPDADLNGDGVVDFGDLPTFQFLFFLPPGPSGLVP